MECQVVRGSRLVDAFVEEHPGGEGGNALTRGPRDLGSSAGFARVKWKEQHSFLNLRFLISKTAGP